MRGWWRTGKYAQAEGWTVTADTTHRDTQDRDTHTKRDTHEARAAQFGGDWLAIGWLLAGIRGLQEAESVASYHVYSRAGPLQPHAPFHVISA